MVDLFLKICQILYVHVFRIARLKILTGFLLDFLLDIILSHLLQLLEIILSYLLQRGLIILSVGLTEHHLLSLGRHLQSGTFLFPLSNLVKSYLLKSCKEYSWHQWLRCLRLAVATLKNAAEITLPSFPTLLELASVPSSCLLQSLHI